MIFLVTSNFRNTHPKLSREIVRLAPEGTHELQYDAGDFISIGRDTQGRELTPDAIAKQKGSDTVAIIGHLNQGGRLLDPFKQQRECAQCLTETAGGVRKQFKALITQRNFLDKDLEKEEIKDLADKIKTLQAKAAYLIKMAAAFLSADDSKKVDDVKAIISGWVEGATLEPAPSK
jgi:hypothetical protein